MIPQYVYCKAFNTSPVTTDEANITGKIAVDDGALTSLTNNVASHQGNGVYRFTLVTAERTGTRFVFDFASTTVGVNVVLMPESKQYDSGNGIGIRVVLVTVKDDLGDAIPHVQVHIQNAAGESIALNSTANASGVAVFNLDDGDYNGLIASVPGYVTHVAEPFTVDEDNEAVALTLARSSEGIAASRSRLIVNCTDEFGLAEPGAVVHMVLKSLPPGDTGFAYDSSLQSATANINGVASLYGIRLATYRVRRGTSTTWYEVTLADAETTTASSFVGAA